MTLAAVVLRTSSGRQNVFFGTFVLAAIAWGLGDAMMLFSSEPNAIDVGTVLFLVAPLYTTLFLVYFTFVFPNAHMPSRHLTWMVALPPILLTVVGVIKPTSLISSVEITHPYNVVVVNGGPYFVYSLFFLIYLSCAIILLLKRYFAAIGNVRSQIAYSALGISVSSMLALTTNLLMPLLGQTAYLWVGPIATLAFIISVTIAIVKHKLFDIRLVIARTLGYTFTLLMLSTMYGFVVFGAAKLFFNVDLPLVTQISLAAATGVAAFSFPYIRARFDAITNRLFYRDAYDPQTLFADLNRTLVSSLDTSYLMTQSISIIETALKPDFAAVGFSGGKNTYRLFSSRKLDFSDETVAFVRKTTPHIHHKVIVADYIDEARFADLKRVMRENGVAVLVRLTQDVRHTQEGMGYLILGNKKSGNPYTQQDVQTLETVANELIIAVQNALHYEEIQQFNEALQGRVEQATRKLRRSNEKLKALDETKDDFISMASHQLRTPLTSVKGYLSMVLEGDAGKLNDTQKKMLGQAFISSQRMVFLIADLLNVSRLKTGKFVIEAAPTDLPHMIEEELQQLKETADARELKVEYQKPKDFPELMLDETKIRQVVMNFIDNAIYYTPPGGHIKVKLEASGSGVELRVVDNGIGVPKQEQHHLFTKFYRAANARKARPDGTGLGLFMAKKVVVAQGGSIIFDSKEGVGSTFGFRFPHRTVVVTHQPVVAEPAPAK